MNKNIILSAMISVLLFGPTLLSANEPEGLDAASQEALEKTNKLLTNPATRNQALSKDPKGLEHDQEMRKNFGNANTEELYKISAGVMDRLVKETGGDVTKMMKIMADATKNPASMRTRFTADELKKIQEMSRALDSKSMP